MRATGRALLTAVVVLAAGFMGTSPAQAADVGFVGPVYGTSTTAPAGQKPQSKLWVADGIWWGALFDKASADFHIFRYDWDANTWTDTGVLIDERTNMYMDALWDGQHLYVLSAGATASNTAHTPRLVRFSYASATKTWTRDSGYPVSPMGSGGVKSPVIAKDSTGMLWATFFTGSKVYITHSLPGDDRSWVPPYQLPTPNDESSVGSDDISAVVAFDGDKVGVLWSNQLPASETVYWAWHQDGTSDQQWSTQVAYRQPEGADDHINLKSLVGDSSGRVFAVAKTSMDNVSDPLINLLTLNLAGQWSARTIWTKADNSTRAIVQIDSENRQLYAFAAAPCCAGGTIYYKQSPLDNPTFGPGLGTPFIHSDAHPEANNPTSTKQNVTGSTDLVVMASDDETRTYLYNRLDLDGGGSPPDTTAPETTITSAPATTTSATSAAFAFESTESGSTFACSLDGAAEQPCTSPTTYTGVALGDHTFAVRATDTQGNADPSPATRAWTVQEQHIFSDDFSSGGFAAGGWTVEAKKGGTAAVQAGAVHTGNLGARLVSSSTAGSTASIRRSFPAHTTLATGWDAKVTAASSNQSFTLAKIYSSSGRVFSLIRNGSGSLSIQDASATTTIGATLPLNQLRRVTVSVAQGPTADAVSISIDGAEVYSSTNQDLGCRPSAESV
jgi:hypothetical protein